jgi:hypothetical protein
VRPLQREDVGGLLDHADHGTVAAGVAADLADLLLRPVAAVRTEADTLFGLLQRAGELERLVLRRAQEVERKPVSRARANAGQARQLGDQVVDRG